MNSSDLERRLGYAFDDPSLLTLALTHRSAGTPNNERLEFLGDAVLGYVIGNILFSERPNDREDTLTLLRASLVRREMLADIATSLELGSALKLGASAASSGGHRRASILADALEAIIGAIHEDSGLDAARAFIQRHWRSAIDAAEMENLKDSKTRLQEWLQGRGEALPSYTVVATEGAEHQKSYEVHCHIEREAEPAVGVGRSRRAAEKAAAAAMLERLERLS